jgi:hypothetical protein
VPTKRRRRRPECTSGRGRDGGGEHCRFKLIPTACSRQAIDDRTPIKLSRAGPLDASASSPSRAARRLADAVDQRAALAAARPLARVGDPQAGADRPGVADEDRAAPATDRDHHPGADRTRHDPPDPRTDANDHPALRAARRPGHAGRAAGDARVYPVACFGAAAILRLRRDSRRTTAKRLAPRRGMRPRLPSMGMERRLETGHGRVARVLSSR